MVCERREVAIPVQPWFFDHHFDGRIVLAAVDAMQVLAVTVQKVHPHLEVSRMHIGRFARLLEIPPTATVIDALVELEDVEPSEIRARLLTRTQGKVMTRLVTHCELTFVPEAVPCAETEERATGSCLDFPLEISAEQVYRELVPFGPAYRTLQDRLVLDANAAWGTLVAPELEHSQPGPLGSPFPLDGAMHTACVHGQRLANFVPFPVGFAARRIVKPTRPAEWYRTQVLLQSHTLDELIYDVCIFDQEEQVRETVKGLRMRDVSHGRIRPPAWIKKIQEEGKR